MPAKEGSLGQVQTGSKRRKFPIKLIGILLAVIAAAAIILAISNMAQGTIATQPAPAAAPVSAPALEQPVSLPRAQTPEPIEEMFLPGLKISILGEGSIKPPANIESWQGDWKTTLQNGVEVSFRKPTFIEAWVENNQLFMRLTDEENKNKNLGLINLLFTWEVTLKDGTIKKDSELLPMIFTSNPNTNSSMGYQADLTKWAKVAKRIDLFLR